MSLSVPQQIVALSDFLRSLAVMRRAGMYRLAHPLSALDALLKVHQYGPFAGVVMHGVRERPDAPAIVDERGELTFRQLDEQSNALGRGLSARGLRFGDTVGVLARDHRGLVTTLLATGKIGVRVVLLNTGFAPPQLAGVVHSEKISALLYDSEFTATIEAVSETVPRFLTWNDDPPEKTSLPTIDEVADAQSRKPLPIPKKPGGIVILTSGTTGAPKGAPRDRVSPFISAQMVDRIPLPVNGTIVMAAPLFHATGLSQYGLGLALGNRIVFQQRKFDPEKTLAAVAQYRAEALILVPIMLQRIVDLPAEVLAKYDVSALRVIFAAGSAIPRDVVMRCFAQFGDVLYNLYGSTEMSVITVANPSELRRHPTTAGRPPVGIHLKLLDADRKPITEPEKTGTIFLANAHSFRGYTDGHTKETVAGMMSSGDVGHLDRDGLLFIDGRDDDMIVSGGENVFPQEIEDL
ncbi:MAG: long-chain-fatty-acid--CoA ligase FadD2, partial [Mycobacterium sp.]|nr:long-chain-fatty-acid--CoA ligase FadD2 [Mycobacterium sp.]